MIVFHINIISMCTLPLSIMKAQLFIILLLGRTHYLHIRPTYFIYKWTSTMLDNFHFIRNRVFHCFVYDIYSIMMDSILPELERRRMLPRIYSDNITTLHVQVELYLYFRCEWSLLLIDRDLNTAQF